MLWLRFMLRCYSFMVMFWLGGWLWLKRGCGYDYVHGYGWSYGYVIVWVSLWCVYDYSLESATNYGMWGWFSSHNQPYFWTWELIGVSRMADQGLETLWGYKRKTKVRFPLKKTQKNLWTPPENVFESDYLPSPFKASPRCSEIQELVAIISQSMPLDQGQRCRHDDCMARHAHVKGGPFEP